MITLSEIDGGWEAVVTIRGLDDTQAVLVRTTSGTKEGAYHLAKVQAVISLGQIVKLVVDQEL